MKKLIILFLFSLCISDAAWAIPTAQVPTIVTDLKASVGIAIGVEKQFSIEASSATSYQWYKAVSSTSYDNATAIEGEIDPSYDYTATAAGTEYIFCDASNNKGTTHSTICTVITETGYSIKMNAITFGSDLDGLEYVLSTAVDLTNVSFDIEFPGCIGVNQLYTVTKALVTTTATTAIDDDEAGNVNVAIIRKSTKTITDGDTVAKLELGYDGQLLSAGQYEMTIKNITLTDTDGKEHYAAPYIVKIGINEKPLFVFDESSVTQETLSDLKESETEINVQENRTFYRGGVSNTVCLPFSLTKAQLDASLPEGYSLKEFSTATIKYQGSDFQTIELTLTDVEQIEAGEPYVISWSGSGENIVNPVFNSVTVTVDEPGSSESSNNVSFKGTLVPMAVTANDKSIMFMTSDGTLKWPDADGTIKAFRCYFKIESDE